MIVEQGMTSKERLDRVFAGQKADRTPFIGGWIAYTPHIIELAGATKDEYLSDPEGVSLRAYQNLKADGLIDLMAPINADEYRIIDHDSYAKSETMPLEKCIEEIESSPSPEKLVDDYDFESEYAEFKKELIRRRALCGDIVWMPAQWTAGARADWYLDFGYENYFYIIAGYPDVAQKLMEIAGAKGRNVSRLVAQAVKDDLYPKAILMGIDICTQRGPMVSPDFLEKYYAPQLKYGLEPLLEVGCRPVWHCDGDCRLLLDMLLDCGVQGFQGFQPECGMKLEEIVKKRTNDNKRLLIFGPLSVTSELPVCTPDQIRQKVRNAIEICKDNADLIFFTSNTINPDAPVENIIAMYDEVVNYRIS